MDQALLKDFEARCTQDAPPACRAACPLHMDVRQFMSHMQAGFWDKARTILDKALPFAPLLTALCEHPCEDACVRGKQGSPLAVGDLERACISFAPQMSKFVPVPAKSKKVGILGVGISGLAAAWELALKGFEPTVLYSGGSPENFLLACLASSGRGFAPGVDISGLVADAFSALRNMKVELTPVSGSERYLSENPDAFLKEARQGKDGLFIDLRCFPSLAPVSSMDAATGTAGDDLALCYGGVEESFIMNAFEGRRGAISLGRVLGGASPSALREHEKPYESRLHADISGLVGQARVIPASGVFSKTEAQAESERCIACECMQCVKQCVYLRDYGEYPKIYARQMFLNLGIYTGYRRLNSQINSCALCGQCERICPDNFSMSDFCLLLREEMVRQNKMPPSAHSFALQELEAATEEAATLAFGGKQGVCSHAFFPGCQLAAARPSQVRFVFRHLRQSFAPDTGIWLDCCGIPAQFAGRVELVQRQATRLKSQWLSLGRPVLVMACASCLRFFRKQLPDLPVRSLWEVLDKEAALPPVFWRSGFFATDGDEPVVRGSIHDPCSARDDTVWQESVRNLLRKAEFAFDEPFTAGRTTSCCGYGGLVWNANPEMSSAMARDRADKLAADAVTSCIMCREQFIAAGKNSWHLFDILLPQEKELEEWLAKNPSEPDIAGAYSRCAVHGLGESFRDGSLPGNRGPGFSRRRQNRILLKKLFRTFEFGLEPEDKTLDEPALKLQMTKAVLDELEQKHILEQDIAAAIREAEEDKTFFCDRKHDCRLARHTRGSVTFWVCYRRQKDTCTVLDAYKHRMTIVPIPHQNS